MSSYWGLDWKTGAARRLRPLRRDAAVFLDFSKRNQNWGFQNTPLFPLAKELTHRQIQTVAWAQQREQVSHFSCAFFSQGFEQSL